MFNKPNLKLPLAASYNERGIRGFNKTVTQGLDQRKINSMYEPVKNALTGKTTLYLVKRPGVSDSGSTFGTTGQVAYLASQAAGSFGSPASEQWVYSVDGNDVRASSSAATQVIVTAAGYKPVYVDKTSISGTDTVVLQLRNALGTITVWFSNTLATWTQITDSDFTGIGLSGKMEFMDGYAFGAAATTGRIHNSDLNSLANWTASNYITKQIKQDPCIGLMKFGKQIIAAGRQTSEIFVNQRTPSGSPLVSVPGIFGKFGILTYGTTVGATNYYTICSGKLYFIGRPEGGLFTTCLVSYNGQSFDKVSPTPIDKIMSEVTVYSINSVAFSGKQAIALSLTAPTESTQRWLMYFPEWNDWFEWNSTVICSVNNGVYFLGVGANQHKIYNLSFTAENFQDEGVDYTWTHQFQLPSNGNERQFMPYMALKGDTARSAQNISVEFSDDDYQNFSTARTIDMTSKQKMLTRCGSWEGSRVVRLSHTGNTEVRLSEFLARIE